MYLYIVDSFAQDKRFQKDLTFIQARVQDLGIPGRFEKLTILKSIKDIVQDAERKGVQTIVIVGNDKTLNTVISHLADSTITVGLIPLGEEHNNIARTLGIPSGPQACTVLSKRIIKKLDLGEVNGKFFLSCLDIPTAGSVNIECDKSYIVRSRNPLSIRIVNFGTGEWHSNAHDGKLEAVVENAETHNWLPSLFSKRPRVTRSVFPITTATIKSSEETLPIYSEGHVMVKTPARVNVAKKKLRMIVGF